jgi:nucleoid DNA-binding protein
MTKQPTLTKADLIEEVLKVTELPRKESETIVETIFDSIIKPSKRRKIEIRGFGSFQNPAARSRVGRNPKTGEK